MENQVVLVDEVVQLPKESNEVRKFVVALVKDLKAKKPTTEIVAGNLAGLMAAMEGFDKIPSEAKTSHELKLGALLAADLIEIFRG